MKEDIFWEFRGEFEDTSSPGMVTSWSIYQTGIESPVVSGLTWQQARKIVRSHNESLNDEPLEDLEEYLSAQVEEIERDWWEDHAVDNTDVLEERSKQ